MFCGAFWGVVWPEGTVAIFFLLTDSNMPVDSSVISSRRVSQCKQNTDLRLTGFVWAWLCVCVCVCAVGRQPGSSAVYSILCSRRLVDRAPTAVVLMRLADYCSPSPRSTSAPFLSTRQPCRASVANPGQAGPGWTLNTHLYTNTHTHTRVLNT